MIQYGSPRQALRLAQRVGRSGHTHKGTAKGVVISANAVETLETLSIFNLVRSGSFETFKPQFCALDVLANQICGILLDKRSMEIGQLKDILNGSFVYAGLESEALVKLLKFMAGLRLLGFDGRTITAGGRTRMDHYSHLSVIPDSKRFVVKNIVENRIISTLDDRFVASNVEEGSVFITKGLPWKVISIDDDIISVEPSTDLDAAIPDWTGEDIPVSRDTVLGVFHLLNSPAGAVGQDAHSVRAVNELIAKQAASFLPSDRALFVESLEEYCVIYTGLGTQANEALSRLLAHMVSARLGRSVTSAHHRT